MIISNKLHAHAIFICFFMMAFIALSNDSAIQKNKPKIMAHYMPWYISKPISGYWGWHWTMSHFDPEKIDKSGKREIASHYYPLIGAYDSYDPAVLEYHILLMKISGIDGIIIDWYGIEDFFDYAILNRNTSLIIDFARKAGLEFAICYEDQTVKHMVNNNYLNENNTIENAQKTMIFLQDNWFCDDLYLKLDDKPVFLVFGPQYFMESSQWDSIFSVLDIRPCFFTQNLPLFSLSSGAFLWVPVWLSDDVLSWETCNKYIDEFYEKSASWDFVIGGAFPEFNDIYSKAKVSKSHAYLDAREGRTFADTLQKAIDKHADIIQIITWNDFGEGTNIEPTEEYGYNYLQTIQNTKRKYIDLSFQYKSNDLALCKRFYDLRIKYKNDKEKMIMLDDVFNLLIMGKSADAEKIMTEIDS
jgi:hypothetical protein